LVEVDLESGQPNGGATQRAPTASDEILQRYRHIEREADSRGRILGIRRLRPSEQSKITGMTPDLGGYDLVPRFGDDDAEDLKPLRLSHRMPLMMAASVCEIDGNPIPFPRNRQELDSIYDQLDAEGIQAIVAAATRLGETQIAEAARREASKNLSGTPTSA
jgi:hypothetical protein